MEVKSCLYILCNLKYIKGVEKSKNKLINIKTKEKERLN